MTSARVQTWSPSMHFELAARSDARSNSSSGRSRSRRPFASATVALSEMSSKAVSAAPSPQPKVDTKPASDVLAGAMARAASQGTIHPLDTLKVRLGGTPYVL